MGNIPQVKCHPHVDSPTDPGFKSVVSDPLEEYCTADSLYDALWAIMRSPVNPMESFVVKDQQIVEHGEEEFTIKVHFDGQKLKFYGLAADAKDYCKLHQRVVGNRKERAIVTQDMKGDGRPVWTGCCKLLAAPLRLEYSRVVDGERRSGEHLAALVESTYLAPALAMLAKRKVMVHPNHESKLHGGGQSVITDAMDEWLTYDTAIEFFVDALKYPVEVPGAEQKSELTETEDGWELVIFEHEKLKELNLARDSTLPTRDLRHLGRVDRAAGEVVIVCSVGQELLYTSFVHFHKDPLCVESWQITDGKRLGGVVEACVLQGYVDHIIAKSEGQLGWYF